MGFQKFTPDSRTTIKWASGTSTEIFIYPSTASFADRNFLFRISTATVEAEESTFTFFKGITRHLMVLRSELELVHLGRYSKHLKPFDQDTFSGEWDTRSRGRVTDFNLMLSAEAAGSLKHHRIEPGATIAFASKAPFYFIYIVSGIATLSNDGVARAGDLLYFDESTQLTFHAREDCDLIEIEVRSTGKPVQGAT